jgi:hypothetical protein
MTASIESEDLGARMRAAISLAWSLLAKKVGGGLIVINKEASLQLHFGYVLQQLLPLITFHESETFELELETGAEFGDSRCEIDVLFTGSSAKSHTHCIAVELKCYRTLASSGGKRGATDIFMKDVYEDLAVLEAYQVGGYADEGVALVMNDMERLVHPTDKTAKCWHYDISQGAAFGPVVLNTPIGGKDVSITLKRHYQLEWRQYGDFWFLEAQGKKASSTS